MNTALAEGDLDVNLFQHIKYPAQYNVADRTDSGAPPRSPAGLYWTGSDKVEDIADGTGWSSPTTPPTRAAP